MIFEVGFNVACNVGNAEGQPVEEKQQQAGMVFLEVAAVGPFDAKDAVEPIEMIEVTGENAENFEFEPTHFQDNADQTDGKNYSGGQAVDGVLTQCHGRVTKHIFFKQKTAHEMPK